MKNRSTDLERSQEVGGKVKAFSERREALCSGLSELISAASAELIGLGFSDEMARLDCLQTLKMVVDDLYDQCDVGLARKEWYREYLFLCSENG